MLRFLGFLLFVIAFPEAGFSQDVRTRETPSVRMAPEYTTDLPSLIALIDAIETATPEDYFGVTVMLNSPSELGFVRKVATDLSIPRIMADVEFGPALGGSSIKIGSLYPDGAWEREVCQVRTRAMLSRLTHVELMPADTWPVTQLYVYASAHVIKEFVNGTFVNGASITDGSRQDRRYEAKLKEVFVREHATKMQLPANFSALPGCEQYSQVLDAPILSGTPVYLSAEETSLRPEELLRRQLGALAPNVPITLSLMFEQPQSPSALGLLVANYRVDGLYSNLSPEGDDHVAALVELSIHGSPIPDQVERTICQTKLGDGQGNFYAVSSWVATSAEVSMDVAKAWSLIADQSLASVRLASVFETGELERLVAYYVSRESEGYPVSRSIDLPAGCEPYFHYVE